MVRVCKLRRPLGVGQNDAMLLKLLSNYYQAAVFEKSDWLFFMIMY
jgi:hypothetical protein